MKIILTSKEKITDEEMKELNEQCERFIQHAHAGIVLPSKYKIEYLEDNNKNCIDDESEKLQQSINELQSSIDFNQLLLLLMHFSIIAFAFMIGMML